MTQQQFREDADLNEVMRRFGVTDGAKMPTGVSDPRFYGDFTSSMDLREALDNIKNMTDRFNDLPSRIRAEFHNDPAELYDWISDEKNVPEAIKRGFLATDNPAYFNEDAPRDEAKIAAIKARKAAERKAAQPPTTPK